MPEAALHAALIHYLVEVLKWLFFGQVCAIHENLGFFQSPELNEPPVAPDIAVIKGIPFQPVSSWRVGTTGPAPQVIFEILSGETWYRDITEKPALYARMGVQEYFAYDPNLIPLTEATAQRLFGWRLDPEQGRMVPLALQSGGYLWSSELDSFLVPDESLLRLYDRDNQPRLTQAEAAARRANALAEKLRSLGIDPDQV